MKEIPIFIIFILICSIVSGLEFQNFEQWQHYISKEADRVADYESHKIIKQNRDTREYQVGDQRTFWRWDLSVMPPSWEQSSATCRAVGEFSYVFVNDDDWQIYMDESDVQLVSNYLEYQTMNIDTMGVVEMDQQLFGVMPDELDNDPRLIVYYSALGSFQGTSFDGYFSSYNQVTEAEAQQMNPAGHSNECEMIYMTCHPLDPIDPIRISVLAHELQHLIHWGYDPNELLWLNEGMSELAMVAFGMPDPITDFNDNPDNSLIEWNQQFSDYVKTMLFFTYLYEHFDNGNLISDIVADTENSMDSIINQLILHGYQIPIQAVFNYWVTANYMDDPDLNNGIYNYELLDLPNFHPVFTHSTFPADNTGSVEPWAGEYVRFYLPETDLQLYIEADHPINPGIIYFGADEIVPIVEFNNSDTNFSIDVNSGNGQYSIAILVIPNASDLELNYSYNIVDTGVSSDDTDIPNAISMQCYPNPFNPLTTFSFHKIDPQEAIKIMIYNAKGQIIKSAVTKEIFFSWDATDDAGKQLPSGIYFCVAEFGGGKVVSKIVLMK